MVVVVIGLLGGGGEGEGGGGGQGSVVWTS